MMKELKLKVAEATQDDVNKGVVRIDSAYMRELNIRPGDIVEISGERNTVGIVDRALPGDIGLNIIRMDPLIRRNAKTSIGEMVSIKTVDVKEAKKVTIAPAREDVMIRANNAVFKKGLLGRALVKGDIVSLGGSRRRRSALSSSPFFDEIINPSLLEAMLPMGLADLKFIVTETSPKDSAIIITENTEVIYDPEAQELDGDKVIDISYEDIGGLDEEITKVREMVELPLKHPEIFERLGIEPPKGVLLHGPPGTGKTLLAKAVANETNSNFILINGPEIMSKYYGQSEENLRKKFEEAEKNAPSIIFIDELDAIATKREESKGEVERRVVAQLLTMMDGLKTRGKVVVMGATNIPNSLDPALRRPGRFDREIEIGVPQKEGRLKILKIHTRNMPLYYLTSEIVRDEIIAKAKKAKVSDKALESIKKGTFLNKLSSAFIKKEGFGLRSLEEVKKSLSEEDKEQLKQLENLGVFNNLENDAVSRGVSVMLDDQARVTHGFVGADLSALAREAAMLVLRRVLPELNRNEDTIPKELLEKLRVTRDDLKEALKVVRPSALREVLIEMPNVKWDDVGGMDYVKQELREAVEWPLKYGSAFKRLGIRPPKGVLLYGPPGTGKTLLAKAIANESEANFITVKGPELLSKWVGESEKGIRKIFEKARQASPAIIFFDEIDSIASRRVAEESSKVHESVVNQLLTELDGLEELNEVVVIAASNRPDIIDTALLRPGRFDRIILASVPDAKSRREILEVHLKGVPIAKDVQKQDLIDKMNNYVGADIEAVVREAAMLALRESIDCKEVKMKHFEEALKKVRPSASKEIGEMYKELEGQFRSARAKEMQESKPAYYG